MQYISVRLFKKVVDHALKEGMIPEDFAVLPTPISSLSDIQAVPADHFFELHELVDRNLPVGFAVRVGQEMKIEDYGVLGLSWRTCSWAGEIFDRCERYFKLLSNTYLFKVEKGEDISRVFLYRKPYRRGVALSNEATLSATVVVLKAMTESDIAPVEVSFVHAAPVDQSIHNTIFKCPVHFDRKETYIAYRTSDLEMRTAKADHSINQFLVERVQEETEGIEIHASRISVDVENLIKEALPSGIPPVHQIARQMGMSTRTLTRRLSENDLTFRRLIQKVQQNISQQLLKSSAQSIAEIAFETGFSDQSAFHRAFKRWTGASPVEYRRAE